MSAPKPAPVSTIGYLVAHCREAKTGTGFSGTEAWWVRQGEGSPVKVLELPIGRPSFGGLCKRWGQSRIGGTEVFVGSFQRWGMSPDGSLILLELTDDFSILTHKLPAEQEGIFAMRADGTGVRKVTKQSTDAGFRIEWACAVTPGTRRAFASAQAAVFDFSADGRRVAYTDLGAGETGEETPQIFTLDVTTGERRQVTHVPHVPPCEDVPACDEQSHGAPDCLQPWVVPIWSRGFLDDTTIAFTRGRGDSVYGGGTFTVKLAADGTPVGEPQVVGVVALPGGSVVPVFEITGAPSAVVAVVPGLPENGPGPRGDVVAEVFLIEPRGTSAAGPRVLQLTNYARSDTYFAVMSVDRQRVFFVASADPLGTNLSQQQQWFSIDRLGGDLRQLTSFRGGAQGCGVSGAAVDGVTGSLVFDSTCDPLGTNPAGFAVPFAMRPDGSGLRQLAETQGMITEADGTIDVELYAGSLVPPPR